jgi:hypothetical protein
LGVEFPAFCACRESIQTHEVTQTSPYRDISRPMTGINHVSSSANPGTSHDDDLDEILVRLANSSGINYLTGASEPNKRYIRLK